MNNKVYVHTKPNIVSMRVSDDEMEDLSRIMELTNRKASDIMRDAFRLLASRFSEASTCESR